MSKSWTRSYRWTTLGLMADRVWLGNGGWVLWRSTDFDAPVFARFADRDGRLQIVDLFVQREGIDTALLRSLPLSRLEAWANGGYVETKPKLVAGEAIREDIDEPAPDLRTAASWFRTTLFNPEPDEPGWAERMLLAQADDQFRPWRSQRKPLPALTTTPSVDARLTIPAGRPYPDHFYEQVANVYRALVRTGSPAQTMADVNHVPVTTVHRWIRRARALKYLGRAEHGKAG